MKSISINKTKIVKGLTYLLTLILGIVLTFLLQEPAKHLLNRYFSKAEISYEVISISRLSRHEIQEYSKAEKLISFNLNLDDLILNNYYLVKLRLRNEGIPIKRNLKLRVSIDKTSAKFLDIKHKINSPVNKIVPILYTIPDFTWSIKEAKSPFHKPLLRWSAPKLNEDGSPMVSDVDGYNIYRSKLKEVGFGRINAKLIKDTYYIDYSPDMKSTMFYKVEAVKKAGLKSKLSNPISITFPEELAFKPLFKNVVWIDPDIKIEVLDDNIKKPVYHSLKEAIEKESNATIFIINKYREEIKSFDNFVDNVREGIKILYRDDLKFLNGQTNILLTSGLDEDAEIIFYFLFKIYPEVVFDFNLKLDGQPDISFIKKHIPALENNFSEKNENASTTIDKKASITPHLAATFVGKNTIYVLWEHTNDQPYEGMRIFRSEKSSIYEPDQLGVEIYDGAGKSNNLDCDSVLAEDMKTANTSEPPKKVSFPNEPPRKEVFSPFTPSAPLGLRVAGIRINTLQIKASDDYILHLYADNNVVSNKIYTYVLYAYDDKDNSSYPIVVNTTLNDPANDIICNTADH